MNNAPETAKEALRILRRVWVRFSDNSQKNGSGFVGQEPGTVITCAHLVSESGVSVSQVKVGSNLAEVKKLYPDIDLAVLECRERESCQLGDADSLAIGDALMFHNMVWIIELSRFNRGDSRRACTVPRRTSASPY